MNKKLTYKITFPEEITPDWLWSGKRVDVSFKCALARHLDMGESTLRKKNRFNIDEQQRIREFFVEFCS